MDPLWGMGVTKSPLGHTGVVDRGRKISYVHWGRKGQTNKDLLRTNNFDGDLRGSWWPQKGVVCGWQLWGTQGAEKGAVKGILYTVPCSPRGESRKDGGATCGGHCQQLRVADGRRSDLCDYSENTFIPLLCFCRTVEKDTLAFRILGTLHLDKGPERRPVEEEAHWPTIARWSFNSENEDCWTVLDDLKGGIMVKKNLV